MSLKVEISSVDLNPRSPFAAGYGLCGFNCIATISCELKKDTCDQQEPQLISESSRLRNDSCLTKCGTRCVLEPVNAGTP